MGKRPPQRPQTLRSYLEGKPAGEQKRLAVLCGVDPSYISKILAGAERPGLVLAAKLAALCDIPIDSFLHLGRPRKRR